MTNTTPASVAMLKVIEAWGVKHIFGYPGGSFNSTMSALEQEKERLQYIQVRHEQVGALAAAADAKLTGKIAVTFGSAGPGATNLLTGLYDAREDHAPVLALIGQVPHDKMNYNFFQEFDENPIFADVSCYCRTVMTPESLPYVVDKAIREAYKHRGVAVVIIPNDFGYVQIPDVPYKSTSPTDNKPQPEPAATDEEVDQVLTMLKAAKRPVIHVGRGIKNGGDQLIELSKKLQIPLIMTGLTKGLLAEDYEGNLGPVNRAGSKAANEIMDIADLVIALGTDFPFANNVYTRHDFKFIQVDHDEAQFGRHHYLDLGVWADATQFVNKMLERSQPQPASAFFQAAVADQKNWQAYLKKLATRRTDPLEFEPVYNELNRIANDRTVVSLDVGDNTINLLRYMNVKPTNKWVVSALFASMGAGIPGAIAGALSFPDRQVVSISGDGAFSMVMQDLITEKKYHLPILNIVTSNTTLGFIRDEQADIPGMHDYSGIDLEDQDFVKIAEGMGVEGVTVTKSDDLKAAFDQAAEVLAAGRPFVINAKITLKRGFPVEALKVAIKDGRVVETVDPAFNANDVEHHVDDLQGLFDYYDGEELKPLQHFLDEAQVTL
ncbi:MAG: pyruvate oxidase [Lactobacillus sp.]|jgi:pyruvate oxidase|uniref:Pyruvate oxidase n=1 Tax=Lacticaseibacillus suilingensis TaxID=2799577 RepID=A0ABW4BCT6_9LACO|nr:pyruvate oxidase [Lacticaseibacillus suilingensis]MCI1893215.1 pyruvate oxidase [Lactobacillus sp.]MCI1940835.1 pyruvate oxidase [Lactobacillus sp.]MCI1971214.1 pyruvate oxidase [Lactobacillus sp.]MCI2017707.1 pyruvate oxidase [Lactobacillus sp.]MCI2036975.1 pyruvate oxidase [Lactobacillus sp.]